MVKLFAKCTLLLTTTVFSTAVIGHTQAVPHSHEGVMLFLSDYWLIGLVGCAALTMGFLHRMKRSK